jgi:hypothetical protein
MAKRHHIIVEPTDGPTLKSDTIREWMHDADFTVIKTDYMPFQNSWAEQKRGFKFYVTRRDILDAEEYHGVSFHIDFVYQTVKQHFADLAEDNFAVEDNLNLLTRGQ